MSGKRTRRDNMATMIDESLIDEVPSAQYAETFSEINWVDFSPAKDNNETLSTMSDESLQTRSRGDENLNDVDASPEDGTVTLQQNSSWVNLPIESIKSAIDEQLKRFNYLEEVLSFIGRLQDSNQKAWDRRHKMWMK